MFGGALIYMEQLIFGILRQVKLTTSIPAVSMSFILFAKLTGYCCAKQLNFLNISCKTSKELLCLFFLQVISSLFGTVGFFLVEWEARRNAPQGYGPIS